MDSESELISLITQLLFPDQDFDSKMLSLVSQVIYLVWSIDLNSEPKPESEFMSLITQAISIFYPIDSHPKPLQELFLLFTQTISFLYSIDLDSQPTPVQEFVSLAKNLSQEISLANSMDSDWNSKNVEDTIEEILAIEPEPELLSLIYQIFSLVILMKSKSEKFVSLCPQLQVTLENGKFHVSEEVPRSHYGKWECLPGNWVNVNFKGEDAKHFYCKGCKGKNHEEYKKVPVEIKHYLHRKHSLRLVLRKDIKTRECYCCDEDLLEVFYYCLPCDFAMNVDCAKKPLVLSIDHPKWHEHSLVPFPRQAFLTCNLCALADESSLIYMCPPCDFVVHQKCINLPLVIRISRHQHRISFTSSFDQGDWFCGICRRKIDNDYGGYSCIKDGCSYVAHSRCATQRNVWDGKELEGEPEEEEAIEDIEPFVRISDGIIEHFSHQHHHLKIDENTDREYEEHRECQACITPIYFGNFYTCMQCDFILHEKCANLSRKIHHPIHPHLLTLEDKNLVKPGIKCSACPWFCTVGFFYNCSKEGCDFKLNVQCATISEPLVHESHIHPLFLTSKPEEELRLCSVCNKTQKRKTNETFNCLECDFALCFGCATLPQKARYKHDKHVLPLSYGKEASTMTYWCEVCEGKINPKKGLYMCDEYCCVTLHIECLLGRDFYMKPGSHINTALGKANVLLNNHHMSRPICLFCEKRCPDKTVLQLDLSIFAGSFFCSLLCVHKSAETSDIWLKQRKLTRENEQVKL
ncbi:Protein VACUOLELESS GAMETOPHYTES [Cardamine amara subsp. amara]|uniref:Protein VACUOLELESS GAMETOPHYTES n=1 Tax=Cardamine amara subsp. amara TaxID=228776 RepID=A0ABD1BZD7_CARAN